MIFYRSLRNPAGKPRSLATIRGLAILTLVAYPAGALMRVFLGDNLAVKATGLSLVLASVIGLALLAGTRLNRITGEQLTQLDEYERNLRASAMETAFQLFTALVLLGIVYVAIASDKGWWVPSGYDEWNGVFWGAFLYSLTLPTAVLAFRLRDEDEEPA